MVEYARNEIRDLIISFVILSLCFTISTVKMNFHDAISILPIVTVGVGLGFILRELAQKFVAIKYGYNAEFKLWPLGLLITFISSLLGFVLAFVGLIEIDADDVSDEIKGRTAVAGPMANMALALLFIVIAALIYPLRSYSIVFNLIFLINTVGFSVNSFLAAFNLLPLWTLDGLNVFKWDVKIWIVTFVLACAMLAMATFIGAEKMVMALIQMQI
ncbi:site-2 protease family protein [uncultured Methanobrevibacter sp.]|uniref:site-2 protease family protein n=2 Tax=uncultured Methanobrevibacter sp. TaxID=253161 RepID=UPI0025E90B06|nr:site-2 protease family protein [uncultured Methanobrevibacter sp.]